MSWSLFFQLFLLMVVLAILIACVAGAIIKDLYEYREANAKSEHDRVYSK